MGLTRRMKGEPNRIVLVMSGPATRDQVIAVSERVRVLIEESRASVVICDVSDLYPDAVAVDLLARLKLTARRCGCELDVRDAGRELTVLLGFCGLRDIASP
jgi:ABC-type transporter Mla MlaB component